MRELDTYKVTDVNDSIKVEATDVDRVGKPNDTYTVTADGQKVLDIVFQSGDLKSGVTGITDEAMLAIMEDRLIKIQNANPKDEYSHSIACIQWAMHLLKGLLVPTKTKEL